MSERSRAWVNARPEGLPPGVLGDRGEASFSPCGRYRYYLMRRFGDAPTDVEKWRPFVVIMLNPSTASQDDDDPTIRRVIRFAKDWGHTELHVLNIFALRSPNPHTLEHHADPVGPENDRYLETYLRWSRVAGVGGCPVLAAWGTWGKLRGRGFRVRHQIGQLADSAVSPIKWECLGTNDDGSPKHPLYVKADRMPVPFGY